jgi:hypothetical protein
VQVIHKALANSQPVALVRSRADVAVCHIMHKSRSYCDESTALPHLRKVMACNLEAQLGSAVAKQLPPPFLVAGEPLGPAGSSLPFDQARLLHWISEAARHAGMQTSGLQEELPSSDPVQYQQKIQHGNPAYEAGHPAPSAPQLPPYLEPAGTGTGVCHRNPQVSPLWCPATLSYPQCGPTAAGTPAAPVPGAHHVPFKIAVYGAPNAGKSSLIRLLVGMQHAATGEGNACVQHGAATASMRSKWRRAASATVMRHAAVWLVCHTSCNCCCIWSPTAVLGDEYPCTAAGQQHLAVACVQHIFCDRRCLGFPMPMTSHW